MEDVIYDLAAWTSVAAKEMPGDLTAITTALAHHPKTDVVTVVCVVVAVLAAEHGDRDRLPEEVVDVLGEPPRFAEGYRELLDYLADPFRTDLHTATPTIGDNEVGTWLLDLMFALTLLTRPPGEGAAGQVFSAAAMGQRHGLLPGGGV